MKYLLSILLIISTTLLSAQNHQKRLALVIGNSDYKFAGQLKHPAKDAELIAQTLKDLDFLVILGTNTNKDKLDSLSRQFFSMLDTFETGLVYYSGHGINSMGKNYILPIEANLSSTEQLEKELYPMDSLILAMDKSHTKFNFVLTDAYRNNRFCRLKDIHPGFIANQVPENFCFVHSASPSSVACECYCIDGLFAEILVKYLLPIWK